ncbi:MAG: hypothetical protein BWY75_02578 [bacterium ADurb.Bin425]|nr:MAG: hypothetical protein BWY75_02578 [bacterium ADurb.Bin425]
MIISNGSKKRHGSKNRRSKEHYRRQSEHNGVGADGSDVFFEEQLDGIGSGLQIAIRSNDIGTLTHSKESQGTALDQNHEHGVDWNKDQDRDDRCDETQNLVDEHGSFAQTVLQKHGQ